MILETFAFALITYLPSLKLLMSALFTSKDFKPVAIIGFTPVALVIHESVPATSVQELIELLRSKPDKWAYASCGNGTTMHLAGELFKQLTKTQMEHVSYRGCGPAVTDGIAGHVSILFNTLPSVAPHVKSGRLKILALTSPSRSPLDPSVPALSETAELMGFDAEIWAGVLAPAGVPHDVVQKLNTLVNDAIASPDVQQKLAALYNSVRLMSPNEFGTMIEHDLTRWSKLVREAGIKGD